MNAAAIKINQPIVAYRVVAAESEPAPLGPARADVNPLELRIERRPDGVLPSETNKMELSTQEGRKRFYLTVTYIPVCGVHNGKDVCIERPLEFFIPAGQHEGDHQWVAATMRSLSLAARGGFVAKALADLRYVTWTKGPVRYGTTRSGKPMYHDSEVAALAYAIQKMLHARGFLDENGNQNKLDLLARHYEARLNAREALRMVPDDAGAGSASVVHDAPGDEARNRTRDGMPIVGKCPDKQCGGDLVLMDNCPTCVDCGYSKCG